MSYTKQTHVAGQKLTAAQLNYMENGIAAAQNVHNLLDNSNFRNPVNQRGITSQIGGGYGIDRWRADGSGVITVAENGITLNDEISFRQPVRLKAGIYTLAFKPIDEKLLIISFQFDGAETLQTVYSDATMTGAYINYYKHATGIVTCQFVLSNGYEYTLEWAALYEGSYTAETLPTYVSKGYGAELAECQRYLRVLPESTLIFSSVLQNGIYNTNSIYFDRLRDNITPSVSWLDYFPGGGTGAFGIIQGVSYVTINDVTAMVYPDRIQFTTTKSYGGHAFEIKRCLLSAEL